MSSNFSFEDAKDVITTGTANIIKSYQDFFDELCELPPFVTVAVSLILITAFSPIWVPVYLIINKVKENKR